MTFDPPVQQLAREIGLVALPPVTRFLVTRDAQIARHDVAAQPPDGYGNYRQPVCTHVDVSAETRYQVTVAATRLEQWADDRG